MINPARPHSDQNCKRCGTCCSKGGPALHKIDHGLVTTGAIAIADLFTIRAGEMVFDQIKGMVEPLPEEIIKIKGIDARNWRCRYFDASQNGCRIYSNRPFECRILTCWDTKAIAAAYRHERLSRKDLLEKVPGLMELIAFHETHCNPEQIRRWTQDLAIQDITTNQRARKAIAESLHWDLRIRQLAHKKAHTLPGQMEFLFGRPLREIMKMPGQDNVIVSIKNNNKPLD